MASMDPDKRDGADRLSWIDSLSTSELQALRSYVWDRLARARKVNVAGQTMTLKSLGDDVAQLQKEFEHGVYDDAVRQLPRWQARQMVPSSQLRAGAYKQVLREDEEDALELTRMGNGNCFAERRRILGFELPAKRNFAYGVFARPECVERSLGPEWAGQNPASVLLNPNFYLDILRRCNQYEMTLMLLTSRPLKLSSFREAVGVKLKDTMEDLQGDALSTEDSASLENFIRLLGDNRVEGFGWVANGMILEGTHIIVTATPKGGLLAEAITPGTLAERKTSFIGSIQNPLVTAAVFGAFLGPKPVDIVGKEQMGRCFLWAANGLPFKPGRLGDKYVARIAPNGKVELPDDVVEEHLHANSLSFCLEDEGTGPPPMFLKRIAFQMS